ncbi:MAG: arginase family protein [Alphaproteobacteria bacterium]|nr:arginase family protein [Alphaproteobacteria bacterium]HPF45599.1 arginase family protein [Emcibacteraceae bacterium]HRW29937.1 arginase family protein [Emcibacteraceae bacterium]
MKSGALKYAIFIALFPAVSFAQLVKKDDTTSHNYFNEDGTMRVAIAKQVQMPSSGGKLAADGPHIMANGGIQDMLRDMGATVRVSNAELSDREKTEYGSWRKMGYANGRLADNVMQNEADGFFTIGFLATCPSSLGMLAGLQQSLTSTDTSSVSILWLDAHADYNTPETTRSGSMGGMPLAIANGLALEQVRRDSKLNPPLPSSHIVTAGLRDVDPMEQHLLDVARIQNITVDDIRNLTKNVYDQMDALSKVSDKIYVHIDLDILDASEVPFHNYPTENGPTSYELAALFKEIFQKYPKTAAIGFASIPAEDPGQVTLKAVNRMVVGAIEGIKERKEDM